MVQGASRSWPWSPGNQILLLALRHLVVNRGKAALQEKILQPDSFFNDLTLRLYSQWGIRRLRGDAGLSELSQ